MNSVQFPKDLSVVFSNSDKHRHRYHCVYSVVLIFSVRKDL